MPKVKITPEKCEKCATKMVRVAIVGSFLLGVFKVVTGILVQSIGVTVDGMQSFGCALVGVFVIGAIRFTKRRPNAKLPYGYGKAEFLVSVAAYAGLFGLGLVMFLASIVLLFQGRDSGPNFMGLPVSVISIFVNYLLFKALHCAATANGSAGLMANAKQNAADMMSSIAVALGVGLAQIGPAFYFCDGLAALIVSIIIIKDSALSWWSDLKILMDRQVSSLKLDQIMAATSGVKDIKSARFVKARKIGQKVWVDLGIELDEDQTVQDVERISNEARIRILRKLNWVSGVDVFPYAS